MSGCARYSLTDWVWSYVSLMHLGFVPAEGQKVMKGGPWWSKGWSRNTNMTQSYRTFKPTLGQIALGNRYEDLRCTAGYLFYLTCVSTMVVCMQVPGTLTRIIDTAAHLCGTVPKYR